MDAADAAESHVPRLPVTDRQLARPKGTGHESRSSAGSTHVPPLSAVPVGLEQPVVADRGTLQRAARAHHDPAGQRIRVIRGIHVRSRLVPPGLRRRFGARAFVPRAVTLYTKPGCHLCEDTRDLLDELADELDLALTSVDISSDPALLAAYRHEIPVLTCEGRELARGRITEAQLVAALRRLRADG